MRNENSSADRSMSNGYLSESHKRRFTITTGIIGAVFFIGQFIVPFVFMMAAMPVMTFSHGFSVKEARPERGALWDNKIFYVETSMTVKTTEESQTTLKMLKAEIEEDPIGVAEVPLENTWLLAGSDRLWLISSSGVGFYQGGEIQLLLERKVLGDISRPFLYEGHPAVIEESPTGLTMMVFVANEWQAKHSFTIKSEEKLCCIKRNLQVLSSDNKLHLFVLLGNTLFYRAGIPKGGESTRDSWQIVTGVSCSWYAALVEGRPAVFYRQITENRQQINGLHLMEDSWEHFFRYDRALSGRMGVYSGGEPGRFVMLLQSFPGSLRLLQVDRTEIISESRFGDGFPSPTRIIPFMFLPHGLMMLMPLLLAIVLSRLMRKYRVCVYKGDAVRPPFASLTRRAVAQLIDMLVVGGPLVVVMLTSIFPIFDVEKFFNLEASVMISGLAALASSFLWILVCYLAFSFVEGKWGATLGKWVVGVRVLGTDLEPCGLKRALVRNILKCVDGFFNFMVGVLVVALSENWQRVGDMAARTVVIDVRAERQDFSSLDRL